MRTDQKLSILAKFDDIRRCMEVLTDGIAEEEFLKVIRLQEKFRQKFIATVEKAERVQRELDASLRSMADLETKLFHARRLLEVESRARKEVENERDTLERKIMAVADLLKHENNLRNETRDKLAFLHTMPNRKRSISRMPKENNNGDDNEFNSTGSFLSDLSITRSEDDFLDVYSGVGNSNRHQKRISVHKKKRLSKDGANIKASGGVTVAGRRSNRRRSRDVIIEKPNKHQNQLNVVEGSGAEHFCATTKVTIPQDGNGAIMAESTIETVPAIIHREDNVTASDNKPDAENQENDRPLMSVFSSKQIHGKQAFQQQMTQTHHFTNKTFIRAEACVVCDKKIRFGCVGLRCRSCSTRCHIECRSHVSMACTPQSNGTPQSGKGASMGYIHDYTPAFSPKIPPIILHCINEIEARGIKEVGLYRVSGSEREVKALKERFLNNPNNHQQLSNIDIHVLCGCVKDFLRTLREPLIPMAMWKDFHNAVQHPTEEEIRKYLLSVVEELPKANRDTLAFLLLHFQRIAECPEVLMPLENIARVFGPTIVGNSTVDPDHRTMFTDVHTQYKVMLNLLKVPFTYWSQFIQINCNNKENYVSTNNNNNDDDKHLLQTPSRDIYKLYATPSKSTLKKCKFRSASPYTKK